MKSLSMVKFPEDDKNVSKKELNFVIKSGCIVDEESLRNSSFLSSVSWNAIDREYRM